MTYWTRQFSRHCAGGTEEIVYKVDKLFARDPSCSITEAEHSVITTMLPNSISSAQITL